MLLLWNFCRGLHPVEMAIGDCSFLYFSQRLIFFFPFHSTRIEYPALFLSIRCATASLCEKRVQVSCQLCGFFSFAVFFMWGTSLIEGMIFRFQNPLWRLFAPFRDVFDQSWASLAVSHSHCITEKSAPFVRLHDGFYDSVLNRSEMFSAERSYVHLPISWWALNLPRAQKI